MLAECGISLFAAWRGESWSPALLAFGLDSFVELLFAALVLLQFSPRAWMSRRVAARIAAILLFALAVIVTLIAVVSLAGNVQPKQAPSAFP